MNNNNEDNNKIKKLWINGLFFLGLFIIIFGTLAGIALLI